VPETPLLVGLHASTSVHPATTALYWAVTKYQVTVNTVNTRDCMSISHPKHKVRFTRSLTASRCSI